jgi:hypothetical protein
MRITEVQLRRLVRGVLLSEAAKQPEDLPPDTYVQIEKQDDMFIVTYCDIEGAVWGTNSVRGNFEAFHSSSDPDYSEKTCHGAWVVAFSRADKGWGPMLYDIAMELAGTDGLTPDRYRVSYSAFEVWDYYLHRRPDVKRKQLDDINPPEGEFRLTPDFSDDDCVQVSTRKVDSGTPWEKSSLSKVYYKPSNDTIKALERKGKLFWL